MKRLEKPADLFLNNGSILGTSKLKENKLNSDVNSAYEVQEKAERGIQLLRSALSIFDILNL